MYLNDFLNSLFQRLIMYSVFIDGQEGTTGLKIHERLKSRKDITILEIPYDKRKDSVTKSEYLNNSDVVILCLPDEAAKESAALIVNPKTKVIDASTAFRTSKDWIYGMPELKNGQRELIKNGKRISNPGCHATGFILSLYPLMDAGIINADYPISCHSLTGYSGGGKKLITSYQDAPSLGKDLNGPRHYALSLNHKHLPEMQKHAGLNSPPIFLPVVGNFYNGMVVSLPFHKKLLSKNVGAKDIHEIFSAYYTSEPFIKVIPFNSEQGLDSGFLSPIECNETNRFDIFVFGNDQQIVVMARFDNLGKGASGAAVQNMNIALGLDETAGLTI
jgi:N-acetyl-gamma-glutamyl-phosphate reductase